jgi:hypothetical protein
VLYPILDLTSHTRDLHWYLRGLEEVVVGALGAASGLQGERVSGLTGGGHRGNGCPASQVGATGGGVKGGGGAAECTGLLVAPGWDCRRAARATCVAAGVCLPPVEPQLIMYQVGPYCTNYTLASGL